MQQALTIALAATEAELQEKGSEIFLAKTPEERSVREHDPCADTRRNRFSKSAPIKPRQGPEVRCYKCTTRESVQPGQGGNQNPEIHLVTKTLVGALPNRAGPEIGRAPQRKLTRKKERATKETNKRRERRQLVRLNITKNAVKKPTVVLLLEQGTPSVMLEIEGRAKHFIIETGSNVSMLQPGVSSSEVKESLLKPFGVTGEDLDVRGQQQVSFTLGVPTFRDNLPVPYSRVKKSFLIFGLLDPCGRCE